MKVKAFFLMLAFLAAACMGGVGISVGYRSLIGIFICILALCAVMGFGFTMKRKFREEGRL